MEKAKYQFEDFLAEVGAGQKEFVTEIDRALVDDGYKRKVESKASGFFVSYAHPKTRRGMLNFLFRKKGLFARIYPDCLHEYSGFLDTLPEAMEKEIEKSFVCKRLIDPGDCNPKCITGYDFYIKDRHYQKCRYGCFQFGIDAESMPVIADFIEHERDGRAASAVNDGGCRFSFSGDEIWQKNI
jgi:hypothetical protein